MDKVRSPMASVAEARVHARRAEPLEPPSLQAMLRTDGDFADGRAPGIDNLLYSADAEFSCFADLALTSPGDYYKEGEGSLIQARSCTWPKPRWKRDKALAWDSGGWLFWLGCFRQRAGMASHRCFGPSCAH